MTTELSTFLKQYASTGQKDDDGKAIFTHTSLQPKASFNIPEDKRSELHRLIAESIYNRKPVYMTERPLKVKPITIDIDLKYPADYTTRQHDERHINELLKLYTGAIITFVDIPEDKNIDAYVFQRSGPYPKNGNIKDGFHILYPDICIDSDIQHLIRIEVLKKINQFLDNPEIGSLPVKNTNDDVVDLSVISSNNWMMYGCMKPALKPYKLTGVFRSKASKAPGQEDTSAAGAGGSVTGTSLGAGLEFEELQTGTSSLEEIESLVNYLSTHNVTKDRTYDIRSEVSDVLEEYLQKSSARKQRGKYNSANFMKKAIKNASDDETQKCQLEEAKHLTALLADWRADSFHHWIEVGLCLHNISPALHETWVEFSKRSENYDPSVDSDRWYSFTESNTGLNIGSLHRWARLDSPKEYNKVHSMMLMPLMMCSVSGSSQDVTAVVYKMYRYQYVCLDAKGKKWAEFVNHGWKITNEGMSLKKKLGHEVLNEYLMLITHYNLKAIDHYDEQKEQFLHKSKSLADITYKLRDITFKEKVMKECIIMFHDPKFQDSLNSNPYLVGLENGVYDLSRGEFRDGRPEDRVSVSTGQDFPDFSDDDVDLTAETAAVPQIQAIFDFMKQVFPKPQTRRFMFLCLASHLEGYNREEYFYLWTGVGGNGKSKLLALFEMAFGDYCFKLPINLLTNKRSQPGQATPELAMSIGKRFGSFQEPDEGARVNTGLMKEFTGNDKMYWRGLYAEGGVMKPMFTAVLLCNAKPKMTSDDEGTWRRLVVIDFIARFVAGTPTPNGKYEFPRNIHLDQMFPNWAPYFFALLTMYHKIYKTEGLKIPQEIKDATYDYRKQSDAYAMFMDEYFQEDEEGRVMLDDSYSIFKEWYSNEFNDKAPPRREYKTYIERKLGQHYGSSAKPGWFGYSLHHLDSILDKKPKDVPDLDHDLTKPNTGSSPCRTLEIPPRSKITPVAKPKPKTQIHDRAAIQFETPLTDRPLEFNESAPTSPKNIN
jgi:P4 family phage/plasmid primase-like protien